jgi:hypothetical protein
MRRWVGPFALVLAAIAAAWPWLALPASLVVLLAAVVARGRMRLVVALVGGALSLVAFTRFAIEIAVPNIVAAGQRSAEEKAVSRLREIRWAEDRAREAGGRFVDLDALVGTIMQAAPFERLGAGVFRSEAFLYAVEPNGAGDRFVAYAWPVARGKGGHRAFALTVDPNALATKSRGEVICEIDNPIYSGASARPDLDAAVGQTPVCGTGSDGSAWRIWDRRRRKLPGR